MSAYNVTAKRWTHGWELHVDGVGVTQSRTLASAEKMTREYIGLSLDIDDLDSIEVIVTPELDPELAAEVRATRDAINCVAKIQRDVAERQRKLVQDLKAAGFTGSDTASVLGVSTQRVSQLAG